MKCGTFTGKEINTHPLRKTLFLRLPHNQQHGKLPVAEGIQPSHHDMWELLAKGHNAFYVKYIPSDTRDRSCPAWGRVKFMALIGQ